jgi:alkylated DNA repair dioxygenase AlkB
VKLFEPTPAEVIKENGTSVTYWPQFLQPEVADQMFSLAEDLAWERPTVTMFGRSFPIPRDVVWISDGQTYTYGSGVNTRPHPWPSWLETLRTRLAEHTKSDYNSCLLNRYLNGSDCVAWHADDESDLGANPVIASVTLGTPRKFRLRNKASKRVVEIRPEHGSLVVMSGSCQRDWEHSVPREKRVLTPRINLTFRMTKTVNL